MKAEPSSQLAPAEPEEGLPVSVKIRERILAARKRFHSNDNIAEFIEPGELEQLMAEVEQKMQGVLGGVTAEGFTLTVEEKVREEGSKRPKLVEREIPFTYNDVKWTKYLIDFK